MRSPADSTILLIDRCLERLEEVVLLSHAITDSLEADEIDNIESLFETRGKEIEKISALETELERAFNSIPERANHKELTDYKLKRDSLFHDIQALDERVNQTIVTSKEAVLTEIRELYRGKKMNARYFNASSFSSAFIDLKE